jgi:hypothetical protein
LIIQNTNAATKTVRDREIMLFKKIKNRKIRKRLTRCKNAVEVYISEKEERES